MSVNQILLGALGVMAAASQAAICCNCGSISGCMVLLSSLLLLLLLSCVLAVATTVAGSPSSPMR